MRDTRRCLVLADSFAEAHGYIAAREPEDDTVYASATPATWREGYLADEVVLLSLDLTLQGVAARTSVTNRAPLTFAGAAHSLRP